MDPYLLALIALIIFSILAILFIKIFGRSPNSSPVGDNDDIESPDPSSHTHSDPHPDDFTLLE